MRSKLIGILAGLVFLVVFAGTSMAQFGSVSGTVTDEVTGLPIEGVAISFSNLHCFTDCIWFTDSAGHYLCDDIPAGTYLVLAHAEGYYPATYPDSVTVIEGQNSPGIDFALTPIGVLGSISGRVTDEETGLGLPMAHVWAHDSVGHSGGDAWSDTAGYYLIQNLAAGQYLVGVHKDGYENEVYPELVPVEEGQNTPDIDFALTPLGGPEYGSISGRVTDEETGLPIVMAQITITGIYGVWHTDTAGYYFCDNLPPGEYFVHAGKAGYVPETYPDSVIVFAGQNTPDIDFALAPMAEHGSISGQITDEETGLPIIMARIRAIGSDNPCYGEAWSDTGGWYAITSLCAGTYQVVASKEGYAPETYPGSVTVLPGENTPGIDFALTPISEYGSISGLVTDEETGAHISSAHLTATGLDNWCFAEAWSDTDGYYIFPHLCPGLYSVDAHKIGYMHETYPGSVLVVAGENTPDIDFALTPVGGPEPGSISGRVTDEETGLPLPMTEITITGMYCVWYTDTAGYYLCDPIPPGSYEVNARKDGYIPETYPDSVFVISGQNTPNVDFTLTAEGEYGLISGRVTDEATGLPIVMARLMAVGLDNWCYGEAWSDTGGYYAIPNLCAGTYGVSAHKPGYLSETYPESVVVIAGETTVGIDFALAPVGNPGSISGMVTNADTEEPIPGAYVWAYGEFGHGCARTNLAGDYTIPGLPAGDYFLSAWALAYRPADYPSFVTVMEGQDTPGIDFALDPHAGPGEGVVSGFVLEDSMFVPIPYAIVFAISWDGQWGFDLTDSAGFYMIEGLQTDDYYAFAIAPGYIGEFYDGVFTWEEATLVTPDAYEVNFYLGPCGSFDGKISGAISSEGSPIEGAFVYAEAEGEVRGFARSSAEGGYVINGLVPGAYTVYASKVSYQDGTYPDPVQVGYGKIGGIDVDLSPVEIGDVTGDGVIDLGDAVSLLNYLYTGGSAPSPWQTGDLNCDGEVNIGDVVHLINYLYKGGPPPCQP